MTSKKSKLEDAKKLRAMIQTWVSNYPSKNNLRMRQLSEASIYSNRKVFDDYSTGLKATVSIVTKEYASGYSVFKHKPNLNPKTYNPTPEQEEEDAHYPGGLFQVENVMFDQDYYDKHFRKVITEIMKSDIYKTYFVTSIIDTTKKYLKTFHNFSDSDFQNGHKPPFANFYIMETHIPLAYNYAQYLEDKGNAKPATNKDGKQNEDFLRLKEYKNNITKTLKEISTLQKKLTSSEAFGAKVDINHDELNNSLRQAYVNLKQKESELSRYKRSDQTICERLLANRLAADLLSLEIHKRIYRRPTEYNAMSRLKVENDGHQEIFEGDVFLTTHGLPYTDLESCSYSPPYLNEEEFHTKLKDAKSLEIKSIITNWGTYILDNIEFENIADAAVDSIIKPPKPKKTK